MDYFTDVFTTFLDLDRVRTLAVYVMVWELSDLITNIYVQKMDEGLTSLEGE